MDRRALNRATGGRSWSRAKAEPGSGSRWRSTTIPDDRSARRVPDGQSRSGSGAGSGTAGQGGFSRWPRVTGVKVLGLHPDRYTVDVVDRGDFEVYGLSPGESRVVEIRSDELGLAGSATVSGDAPADQPLTVTLGPCGGFSGRILDEDGLPLKSAKVRASVLRDGIVSPMDRGFRDHEGITDGDGRFRVEGLTPLRDVKIWIEDPNHPAPKYESKPDKDLGRLAVKGGETRDLGEIRVHANQLQ